MRNVADYIKKSKGKSVGSPSPPCHGVFANASTTVVLAAPPEHQKSHGEISVGNNENILERYSETLRGKIDFGAGLCSRSDTIETGKYTYCIGYRFDHCGARRAAFKPNFLRSFARGSRFKKPSTFSCFL